MGDDPHGNDKHCPSCRCSIDNEELEIIIQEAWGRWIRE